MTQTLHAEKKIPASGRKLQPKWQRVILLSVLAYEAAGCLSGGSMLVISPDGKLMNMPVSIMHGSFADFLVPGIILFGLGVLNAAAFITVLRRKSPDCIMAYLALGGLAIWFGVEIVILQQLHWLHLMWGGPVIIGLLAAIRLIPSR